MAKSSSSAQGRFSLSMARVLELSAAHPGIITMVIAVTAAGILGFYLVIVPPGTVSYP
jgi:hypothetical protein